MYFLIEDEDFLEKYNSILDEKMLKKTLKKNLIANLSIIKYFSKPKQNLMVMKLQIFTIKKFLRWALTILV